MSLRTVVCPTCAEPVPSGRLSCPACGAILAAVSGGAPRPPAEPLLPPELTPATPPPDDASADADEALAAADAPADDPAAVAVPPVLGLVEDAPASPPGAWVPPSRPDAATAGVAAAAMAEPAAVPLIPRAWGRGPAPAIAASGATGPAVTAPIPAEIPTGPTTPAPGAGAAERLDEAAGWVVLAGAMATAIGFLLPWSVVVIGSRGYGGYLDTWGLAGPWHVVVFLAAAVTLALAAVANPVAPWLRSGILPLVLGGVALGVDWPYVFGPLGAGPGAVLAFVGSLLLLAGGITTAVVHRHVASPPTV